MPPPFSILASFENISIGRNSTTPPLSKLPDWQKQIVSDYKKAFDTMQAGEKGAKEIGFSLTDPNKDKSKKDCLLYTSTPSKGFLSSGKSLLEQW